MEDTKIWAALALPGEAKMGVEDPREMERLAKTVEDVAHRRWLVSDDVDEHIEQIKPYIDWGFTTWCSTSRATTRRPPSRATARRSCPGCASASAAEPPVVRAPIRAGATVHRPAPYPTAPGMGVRYATCPYQLGMCERSGNLEIRDRTPPATPIHCTAPVETAPLPRDQGVDR